jgi:putative ABC transport system permease protein
MQVSRELFEALRVSPVLGNGFTADEDRPGAPGVIVLSFGAWRQRFGSDPQIAGRSVTLSGKPVTIVGVMPAGFYYPTRTPEYWTPLGLNPANATRGGHFLGVVARLKPDVTVQQADASMRGIAERLARQYPAASEGETANVVLLQEQMTGAIRPALLTLFAAVGFVVLITCANVANLLLVRASAREKEIAVRKALGATRGRLFAQMLAESLVLSIAGGVIGIGLAYVGLPQILALGATSIPRVADVTIDGRVLLFITAASLLTGVLFGIAPALQASEASVGGVLKEGGRSSTASANRWVRSGLLVLEVALSIILLAGATLLLRSFDKLTHVDPGFEPEHVLAFQVALPPSVYKTDNQSIAFYRNFMDRLEHRGGVRAAGITHVLPLRGSYMLSFDVRGRPPLKPSEQPSANYRAVSPHYLDALGIPLVRGRGITPAETERSQHVAVIDEAFARQHFTNADPIGQGLHIGNGVDGYFDIVGIVGNVHTRGLDEAAAPTMYVPIAQDVFGSMWVVVRGEGDATPLAAVARAALHEIDPALPLYSATPMTTILHESLAPRRFSMTLLVLFAGLALFLAGVGLYGVIAYSVSLRTREIGVRIAIGARPATILRLIVGGGMTLALIGTIAGLAGALALSSFMQSLLFGVKPSDPVSYAATSLLLLLVAGLACFVPARRALRVDPVVALRAE